MNSPGDFFSTTKAISTLSFFIKDSGNNKVILSNLG